MVIRSENVTFKYGDSVSSDEGGQINKGEVSAETASSDEVVPNSLDEFQLALNLVSKYAGKGTGDVSHLVTVLFQGAAGLSVNRSDQKENVKNIGIVLASAVLIADELGLSADAIANEKIRVMAGGK